MRCTDDHHHYELDNFEGPEKQELQFINKTPVDATSGELKTIHDGTTNEEVLAMLIHRMAGLIGKFPDPYSKSARDHMISALADLEMRTASRKKRGVEGKALA